MEGLLQPSFATGFRHWASKTSGAFDKNLAGVCKDQENGAQERSLEGKIEICNLKRVQFIFRQTLHVDQLVVGGPGLNNSIP